jgi:hypothetical protein
MKKRLVLSVLLIMALLFSLMPVASAATIDDVDDQCLRLGPDVYSIYSDNFERERIAQSLASENVIYFKWEGRWYDLKALTSYFDLVPANAVPDEEVNQWDLHYWYKTGDIIEEFTSGLTKEEAIQQAINAIAALPNPDLVTVETYFDYEPSIREARLFVEEAVELGANYSDITNLWLLELLEQRLDELWPEIVQAAKDNLAGDVGDKAAEVDIEGISVVFTAETRTADITISTPLASILELENTGLMVMLGELDTIRGYTVNGVTRSFYNEAGERLSNADIKAMILADAFTALGLEPADEPLMRDLDGKSLSVLVHGKDGRVEFEDTYYFSFSVPVTQEEIDLAKEALADDVGDKAAEVDIEGVSVVFNTATRTADITISTPLASILELENTGLMVMLGELDTIRGYTVNGVTRSFYNEAGERLSNADIKAMILADAFTALGLNPADEPLMRDLDGKSLSVLVHGKDGRVEFEDTYYFSFSVPVTQEEIDLAKEALADDVGDKAAEVDIEGVSVVFNTATRTADITISTPLASILELENTGLMVMLGELDTIRGYTVNGVTRSFYNEAGERLSNADIKAMILADAFTALGLEPADEPLMRDLDGKSLSVLVHGKDGRVEFEDTYHFSFAVPVTEEETRPC